MSQMRRSAVRPWVRLGLDGEPSDKGVLFSAPSGPLELRDMSQKVVCFAGVDTVRALYVGTVRADWRERVESLETGSVVRIGKTEFLFKRMGKAAGYRFSLQASDLGVQALFGSFYSQLENPGGHLKIELSPHFIAGRGVDVIQAALDALARQLLHDCAPSGVAVHLACDVQGWEPGVIGNRLVTRARRRAEYEGVTDVAFDLSEVSATYGGGQTFTLGLPNSLQMCLYRKDIEVLRRDKVDYWRERWLSFTFGDFNQLNDVWRLEMRFHHSVVRELGRSQGADWKSFAQVAPHLTDLWRYALGVHRLHDDSTRKRIDPMWQLLADDLTFHHPATGAELFRQRETSVDSLAKNIQGLIGNILALAAKRNHDGASDEVLAGRVLWSLRQLACWREIARYYSDRRMNEAQLQDSLTERLRERRLRGFA